jgi:hypothetical protein
MVATATAANVARRCTTAPSSARVADDGAGRDGLVSASVGPVSPAAAAVALARAPRRLHQTSGAHHTDIRAAHRRQEAGGRCAHVRGRQCGDGRLADHGPPASVIVCVHALQERNQVWKTCQYPQPTPHTRTEIERETEGATVNDVHARRWACKFAGGHALARMARRRAVGRGT